MKPHTLLPSGLTLLFLFLFSCEKEDNSLPLQDLKPIPVDTKTAQVIEGNNRFGFDLFREVLKVEEEEGKNVMISPLSVELALAMTANGAAGNTLEAFRELFHANDLPEEDLNTSLHDLSKALMEVDPRVIMEIANSIWYRNTFEVEKDFLEVNKTFFNAEIRPLDFDNPRSVGIINGWVDKKTHHRIPTILNGIDRSAVMYLINAIYFKGQWKYSFDKEATRPEPFHPTPETTVEVPMMQRQGDIPYFANGLFSAVELPYGRGNFSMIILLPLPGKSLDEVTEALTPERWHEWMQSFDTLRDVVLHLPRFRFSYEKELNDPLTRLGLGIAFSHRADFSRINPEVSLEISEVKHKTFIQVDEEGTEAAAVTLVGIRVTSAGPPPSLHIDRPFLFIIREKSTDTILFIGRVTDPSAKT